MITIPFALGHIEFYLLVFTRISAALFVAPVFGAKNIPAKVKAGLSFFMALVVAQTLPYEPAAYTTVIELGIVIVKEGITGILIGLFANLSLLIVGFAGHIIDFDIGFSMATVFDPITMTQESISGNLYSFLVMLMLLASDLHYFILTALVDSFGVVKLGGIVYRKEICYHTFLSFITDFMILGFRIVLPVFAVILLLNVILGILAKTAPQMNMFAIGIELKVLVGFLVIMVTIVFLPNITEFIFGESRKLIQMMIRGMT